jgi:hypothetical protein
MYTSVRHDAGPGFRKNGADAGRIAWRVFLKEQLGISRGTSRVMARIPALLSGPPTWGQVRGLVRNQVRGLVRNQVRNQVRSGHDLVSGLAVEQVGKRRSFAGSQKAAFGVGQELVAGVRDIQVTHRELADAILRRKR